MGEGWLRVFVLRVSGGDGADEGEAEFELGVKQVEGVSLYYLLVLKVIVQRGIGLRSYPDVPFF